MDQPQINNEPITLRIHKNKNKVQGFSATVKRDTPIAHFFQELPHHLICMEATICIKEGMLVFNRLLDDYICRCPISKREALELESLLEKGVRKFTDVINDTTAGFYVRLDKL